MLPIGTECTLEVREKVRSGYLLGDGSDTVLLPRKFAQEELELGTKLRVFLYTDSEDRPVATTQVPLAKVGDFALLKVIDTSPHGWFLDWGLDKDLFAPKNEQHSELRVGQSYVFAVYLDNATGRVAAASRLASFLNYDLSSLKLDQEVELLVFGRNERGTQVLVNDEFGGLIYADEPSAALKNGDRLKGFIDVLRPDNKIDVRLRRVGHQGRTDAKAQILAALSRAGGALALGDRSAPQEIFEAVGLSKKAFKAAVGALYKQRLVEPGPNEVRLSALGLEKLKAEIKS